MPIPHPVADTTTIVLLGSFNPKIFQPVWLGTEGLVSKTEAERAEIQVIHPEVAVLSVGPFSLQVLGERFVAETDQPAYFVPLRDLVVGIFRLLRHTPARALGINRQMHFKVAEDLSWEGLGAAIMESIPWAEALQGSQSVGLDLRGSRAKSENGYVQVRLEPSNIEKDGIFVRVNDHYETSGENSQLGLQAITEIIEAEFTGSIERSLHTAKRLLEVACLRQH